MSNDQINDLRYQLIAASINSKSDEDKALMRRATDMIRNLADEVDNLRRRNDAMIGRLQRLIREHERDASADKRLHNGG